MCGLAGWFGLSLEDASTSEQLFRLLMRKAQVRGTDSHGVAYLHGGKVKTHRGLGPVSRWMSRENSRIGRITRSSCVVGHTRAASRGDVTLANAHPFIVGDWIGAHNGTISNSAALMTEAHYAPRGETDSEETLSWLVSKGLTAESFLAIRGWFAMTIVKADASELLIAVDGVTPFAIARVGGGVIWHSLAAALESSLEVVGIHARIEEVKNKILRFPSGDVLDLAPSAGYRQVENKEVARMIEGGRQMEWEGWDA